MGSGKSKKARRPNTKHVPGVPAYLVERFSGTVIVEWLNVSGGLDAAPDWISMHTEIIREGHVWVGVSAQVDGIERTWQRHR